MAVQLEIFFDILDHEVKKKIENQPKTLTEFEWTIPLKIIF